METHYVLAPRSVHKLVIVAVCLANHTRATQRATRKMPVYTADAWTLTEFRQAYQYHPYDVRVFNIHAERR